MVINVISLEWFLSQFHQGHIFIHPDFNTGALSVRLIAGLWSPVDGLRVYSTRDSMVMEFRGYDLVGSGEYLGHYLVRPRYRGAETSLGDVTATAITTLCSIKEYDDGCGGRSELVVIRKNGTISPVKALDISQGEEISDGFNAASNRLIVAISRPDIADDELDKQLEDFCSDIEAAVKGANASRRLIETINDLGGDTATRIRRSVLSNERSKRSVSRRSKPEQ